MLIGETARRLYELLRHTNSELYSMAKLLDAGTFSGVKRRLSGCWAAVCLLVYTHVP